MSKTHKISVARGDGIGPEIMDAVLSILDAAGAAIAVEPIKVGKEIYEQGHPSGIDPEAWDSLRKNKVLLKAPITTPQGGGYKSLNVTIRKSLNLYANVRPCIAYHPFVETMHPDMDVVIIRENEEDLYGGIEHRQTHEVMQALKLITIPGTRRVIRYAFEFARQNNRKKVTCFTKDNIMKITDGLFHKIFNEIAEDYPEIESNHLIIDIGTARLARSPEMFDVIVAPNLYGDIISDVAAELTGSVGLCGTANIGDEAAMFEAIHGSAPDIAGQNIANPSGLLHGAILMLVHLGQIETAERVHNAWLKTIEDGIHTADIYSQSGTFSSKQEVGTNKFAEAVTERLGSSPRTLEPVSYNAPPASLLLERQYRDRTRKKELIGVDVFIDWHGIQPEELASKLQEIHKTDTLELKSISNRGMKVWPEGVPGIFCSDHWRCRYLPKNGQTEIGHDKILSLLGELQAASLDFIKTENLYLFDGEPGFAGDQGE